MTVRATATLVRWLGPWADAARGPAAVERSEVDLGGMRAWIYRPTRVRVRRAWLLAQGLHFAGPADARMDRFARILASTGAVVMSPFLPSFCALRVEPRVVDDFARGFDALVAQPDAAGMRPAVFSISFGSLPALRLAADEARRDRVGALVVFGGYADFAQTLAFVLGDDRALAMPYDPLNVPAALLNVLDDIDTFGLAAPHKARVADAWRAYIEATWGDPQFRKGIGHHDVARALATTRALTEDERALFEIGVGIRPGAGELCRAALARNREKSALLDPRPHVARIRCPVTLVHGVHDDVIPHTQLAALRATFPAHADVSAVSTGLFDHTSAQSVSLAAVARELRGMARIVGALAQAHR